MTWLVFALALSQAPSSVIERLSHLDSPPSRAQLLEAGGEDVAEALARVALDEQATRWQRRVAVASLRHFPGATRRRVLEALVASKVVSLRAAVIEEIGPADGAPLVVAVSRACHDPEPRVVRAAVEALSHLGSEEARRALGELARRESLPAETRAQAARALRALAHLP